MPLPWKKVTRLSQFVSDLHPPKRGGSLVVETGFPTSLIDLFVKNRERMKKPSLGKKKKNKSKKKDTNSVEIADPNILSSTPATATAPAPATLMSLMYPDKFWGPAVYRIENRLSPNCTDGGDRAVDVGGLVDCDAVKKNVAAEKANSRGIFMAILKTFIVVVLALGTKKLAVGITASAFVLLFIEYVGYRMLWCFEPCWKSLENLKFLIQWCSSFNLRDQSRPDCNATIDEIEIEIEIVEERNTVLVVQDEEIQIPEVEFHEETNTKKKKRVMEEDEVGEIAEQKNLHSRSSKFRAKMLKKFVPIKFRGSKKGKKSKAERETRSSNNEQQQEDHEYKSSQPPLLKQAQVVVVEEEGEGKENKINGGIHRSEEEEEEGSMAKICNIVCKKMGRREKKRKTIIVFVLIVAGLVGGRSLGIVLTFTLLVCLTVSWISRERNKCA